MNHQIKIYCRNNNEFRKVQNVLFSQGYEWVDTKKDIIDIYPYSKSIAIITLNKVNKRIWYSTNVIVNDFHIISAKNYINKALSMQSIKDWIDNEFDIEI